jgi:hypothetical protein
MKSFLLLLFFIIMNNCYSQQISMNEFNNQRMKITRQSMTMLAGWGAANLIYSGASATSAKGSDKYFHQMNLIWGGVNLTLGTLGSFLAKNQDGLNYYESLKKQSTVEKIFLFNAGLDVAYVVGGFYIKEKSNNNVLSTEKNKGHGNSLILQGSALFFYDGILFLIHQSHGKQLYKLADKIQISSTVNGIGLLVKF